VLDDIHGIQQSNRCDEILAWEWHREGMKINDGTGKGIRITPGCAWEREWK